MKPIANNPALVDLYQKAGPQKAHLIDDAFSEGVMNAGQRKKAIDRSAFSNLSDDAKHLIRALLLTKIALMQLNVVTYGKSKDVERLMRATAAPLHRAYSAAKTEALRTLKFGADGADGNKRDVLETYIDDTSTLMWEVIDEIEKADDPRVLWAVASLYNEQMILDSRTKKPLTKHSNHQAEAA